jgi:hypothetical protein
VYFTGATAVATIFYATFAGWTLYEIHSGAEDTHALAKAAIASNRPWVGIEAIPTARQESEHWHIDFSVKNFGNSPALHAIPSSDIENVTTTEEVNNAVQRHCTEAEKGTISGEDNSEPFGEVGYVLFPSKIAWLQRQLQNAAVPSNQQNIAYFIGCVTYFDQFGKRPVHHSSFCYYAKTPLVAKEPMFACLAGWRAD